ncbi:MAG TPA: hypothetical protein VFT54_00440 [Acidimicrobiia bacterium]|nr:hypothetical protein [Acidimicrobiia bacterium]
MFERPLRARPSKTYSLATKDDKLTLYRDCKYITSQTESGAVIMRLLAELNRAAVESTSRFAVHAAVVGDDDRVIVIGADSGGGKSTLAAALLQQGLRYGSDEALCLDDNARVVNYPKPISLDPWSWKALGLTADESFEEEAPFTANELGAGYLEEGRVPTDLLIPAFTDGPPSVTPLPPSAVVATVLQLSFNHYRDGARAFALSTGLARVMRAWKVEVGPPIETAKHLLETLP